MQKYVILNPFICANDVHIWSSFALAAACGNHSLQPKAGAAASCKLHRTVNCTCRLLLRAKGTAAGTQNSQLALHLRPYLVVVSRRRRRPVLALIEAETQTKQDTRPAPDYEASNLAEAALELGINNNKQQRQPLVGGPGQQPAAQQPSECSRRNLQPVVTSCHIQARQLQRRWQWPWTWQCRCRWRWRWSCSCSWSCGPRCAWPSRRGVLWLCLAAAAALA